MLLRIRAAAAASLLSCLACAPPDLSGSVEAMVYRFDPHTRSYALERSLVENLESLRALRGRDVVVRSGGEFSTGVEDVRVRRGASFELEWTADDEGVVHPGDLHSLYALSMYRNLDRVASLLRAHGHVPAAPLDVLYFPRMDSVLLGDTRSQFTDNAAFAPGPNVFLIVPSFVLADVPMFLNEGVMAHEFGHAVIHQEAFADVRDGALFDRHAAAMHEGVADLIGFIATGDPNYIGPTIEIDRDLSVPRDYTAADFQLITGEEDGFDPHHDGSVMARAIYELWPKGEDGTLSEAERGRMLELILATLRQLDYATGEFTLATFPNVLVANLPEEERAGACVVLRARLSPFAPELTHCEAP